MNAKEVTELANTINESWGKGLPQLLSFPTSNTVDDEKGESLRIREHYTHTDPAKDPTQTQVWKLSGATGIERSIVIDLMWLSEYRGSQETRVLSIEDMATALPEPDMTASILWGRLFAATTIDILETRGTRISDKLVVLALHQEDAV